MLSVRSLACSVLLLSFLSLVAFCCFFFLCISLLVFSFLLSPPTGVTISAYSALSISFVILLMRWCVSQQRN
ncbi:hypothetical protein EI94DRAFT_1735094 [Lactarius quietus]|nr:hypothetical protein EI94DRAFT_1735094 [Lactarius quietus]